ncbi:MAG TPA: cupredoxin domain-containing protein [Jatrophihabitans sp.]|jgi:plastocyanin|nr:cupredoxin domain-containing protein [Jatrophihabitans sp.]
MVLGRAGAGFAALVLLAACARTAEVNKRPHTGTGTATLARGGVQQVVVNTGVDLRFHPSTIVVHPGRVRIVLVNTAAKGAGPVHNLSFDNLPGADDVPDVQAGYAASATFDAPAPGTYSFVCTIHANQGQTGKLIVK